ncbi:MAG: CocE/NonD family hydrolase [Coleofasciculus chthonoplastes F3-SA18-01]|uniref:CocE/NonD family hydrolase n=1 Tax=Coleofasciculus chthonoplastes TaxID=64178 RepID=UPI0032F88931
MTKIHKQTASILTRDGIRLDADIYYPDTDTDLPVLLMRQPYGRAIASTVVYAHPSWYAAQGYIVVIQDVRGRGTSGGEFQLFTHEVADGIDTINWVSQLPGSNGQVGMYGFSYQGMTQLYAASANLPALKTICPAMMAYDLYADWAYENGAFCFHINFGWGVQLAAETARLKNDPIAYQILYAASRNLPFYDLSPRFIECLNKYTPNSFYDEWQNHPEPGDYWQKLSPNLDGVDLPMLHIGGWFDPYLRGNLRLYKDLAKRSKFPQHLIIGPWAHLPWGRKVGARDFGAEAVSPVDRLQVRWFDQFLKGIDTGLLDKPPVYLFEMGSNQWRYFDSWLQDNQKSYFLSSTGLASVRDDSGTLLSCPVEDSRLGGDKAEGQKEGNNDSLGGLDIIPQSESPAKLPVLPAATDVFVHDPWRPVPAWGGHATIPAGSFDRSAIDSRTDVLTYNSAPFAEDLHLMGDVAIEVFCYSDTSSFDLCAVLSEVLPNGMVYNFTQGYATVSLGQEIKPVRIELQPTCMKITKGNGLRLSLSAACFPAYPVNPGTGVSSAETFMMDAQIITVTVNCGGNLTSKLLLPIA